jgi:hypothetical protein
MTCMRRLVHGHLAFERLPAIAAIATLAVLPACGGDSASDPGTEAPLDAGQPGADASASDAGQSDANPGPSDANAGDAAPNGFPLGAYSGCSYVTSGPGGAGGGGFGGMATLSLSGSTLSVSYGSDGGFPDTSLQFTQSSPTTATLNEGQSLDGITVGCPVLATADTITQLGSGSLTYSGSTLYLSTVGTSALIDAGNGCAINDTSAAFAVECAGNAAPDGGAGDAGPGAGALADRFVGTYACASSVLNYAASVVSSSTDLGTLTITQVNGRITTAYANDTVVSGSLEFVPVTAAAAVPAVSNETMQVTCFMASNPSKTTSTPLHLASSTLTLDGTTVFLAFSGSGCAGAQSNVFLVCDPVAVTDGGLADAGSTHADGSLLP